eukprot:m.13932 g.13932  ORF g.13932 m.13932 type:complete len:121 (+) comp4224_c0_seq1:232-594(+)
MSLQDKLKERQDKRKQTNELAALLGSELDGLIQAKKDRDAAVSGDKKDATYSLYQTLFKYESDDADDLSFEANEILRVYDDTSDWYEGENQEGKRGYFPSNFVRKINMGGSSAMSIEGTS